MPGEPLDSLAQLHHDRIVFQRGRDTLQQAPGLVTAPDPALDKSHFVPARGLRPTHVTDATNAHRQFDEPDR
ncbi:hypothetical protein GCM10022223_40360 [Kineosporia mesophila]|uniref:Catalase n=1 Tax=Kineosporia mesophila TaxID=566012 RepID=A0ABP6ZWM6_9ACTN